MDSLAHLPLVLSPKHLLKAQAMLLHISLTKLDRASSTAISLSLNLQKQTGDSVLLRTMAILKMPSPFTRLAITLEKVTTVNIWWHLTVI